MMCIPDGWVVPGGCRQADIPSREFRSWPEIWDWSGNSNTVIPWSPVLLFHDITLCWCGMVSEKRWCTWLQKTKSDGRKSFNMELWKKMDFWRGLFFHRRAATLMRRIIYQPNYVVDVVNVVDRKELKRRCSDTHAQLQQNWCLLVEGSFCHAIMDRKWCHFAWTPR